MLAGAVKAAAAAAKASKSSSGGSSSSSSSGSSGSSGSSSSGSSGASMAATGKGGSYSIGSDKGKNFVSYGAAGSTMRGSDGSTWTKTSDGPTTITKGARRSPTAALPAPAARAAARPPAVRIRRSARITTRPLRTRAWRIPPRWRRSKSAMRKHRRAVTLRL